MFFKPKKGNLPATFLVLIIIAIIMILMISGFGAKIWRAFFPSQDKSTMQSFEAVHRMLIDKSLSQKDYDSTTMNIYLKDPYRIVIFDDYISMCLDKESGNELFVYDAPEACKKKKGESEKICLCLYKGKPLTEKEKKDKEKETLVKCYNDIENTLEIDRRKIDTDEMICSDSLDGYGSFMFIKRTMYPSTTKPQLHILRLNDSNKELNDEWSIPVCKTTNPKDFCYKKKAGDKIEANTTQSLVEILVYCNNQNSNYKSAGVECVYNPSSENNCFAECKNYDITEQCGTKYKTCEDYNQLNKRIGLEIDAKISYTSIDDDTTNYMMCGEDILFCNVNSNLGCELNTPIVYACKYSDSGSVDSDITNCDLEIKDEENSKIDCEIEYLEELKGIVLNDQFASFINKYDTSNNLCNEYIEKNFYKPTKIMACKEGMEEECKMLIEKEEDFFKEKECELKHINYGKEYLLTHYSSDCKTEINKLFTEVNICKTPPNVLEEEVTVS